MRRPVLNLRALGSSVVLVLASLLLLPASPARADTTLLCQGFRDCHAKGYPNWGYASEYREMHWRMYGGHNCVNYAAYRMIQLGGPQTRPWSGSGNASNWGYALASKTDQTPRVGAIAWWRARNHVQFVEKVVDANTIVVSEDHWGGDFDWAVVRRGDGSNWPTGFIHIVDTVLKASTAPSAPSQPQVGVPITADAGDWPAGAQLKYQWLVAASPGSKGGWPIDGATSRTFVPRAQDAGKWLLFRVIASEPGYRNGKAYSQKTQPVALGRQQADGSVSVDGFPKVGATLQGRTPDFSPQPGSLHRQWFADGKPIPGAHDETLTLTPPMLGKQIAYWVTAHTDGYQDLTLGSHRTVAVGPADLHLTSPVRLTGRPRFGSTLTLDPGAVNLSDASLSYQWLRDGEPLGVSGRSYTLGAADLGHRISVKVDWSRTGYDDVVKQLSTRGVRSVPQLQVLSTSGDSVRFAITVPGGGHVYGRSRLLLDNGKAWHDWVSGGQGRFKGYLPLGAVKGTISYVGNRYALPGSWKVSLTVTR